MSYSYSDIGRKAKRKFPREYRDLSDYEAGKAYVAAHFTSAEQSKIQDDQVVKYIPPAPTPAYQPPTISHPSSRFEPPRQAFAKWGSKREEYQTHAQQERLKQEDISAHGLDRIEMNFHKEYVDHVVHKETANVNLKSQEVNYELLEANAAAAKKEGLTLHGYDTKSTFEATEQIRLLNRQKEIEQDIEKAKRLDEIKIATYRAEIEADLDAVMAQRLIDHNEVLRIKNHLFQLFAELDGIEQNPSYSRTTKNRLIEQQEDLIKAFQESLSVQMARYLLKKRDGKDGEAGIEAASDSPSGN